MYDLENTRGPDTDFYLRLATDLGARTILDLGCGTGLLTRELALDGRHVVGVDPSPAMLAVARRHINSGRVTWTEGDAGALGAPDADLVLMTGNVAQVFLDDSEWSTTLRHIHTALRPGGHLAFESRNPVARGWETWNREATYTQFDSPFGPMESWLELVHVGNGRVRFNGHTVFKTSGEVMIASSELRFRTLAELKSSLTDAGFAALQVYGDWNGEPFTATSRFMVFVARRN